jgi:hypothetical protein
MVVAVACEIQQCSGSVLCVQLKSVFAKAVPTVSVVVSNPGKNYSERGRTGVKGEFCAVDIPPGMYTVDLQPGFYLPMTISEITVYPSTERWLVVELQPREIHGFEILTDAILVGQSGDDAKSAGAVRICFQHRERRHCEGLSRWGEYNLKIPLGAVTAWFETEAGDSFCKRQLNVKTETRMVLACLP